MLFEKHHIHINGRTSRRDLFNDTATAIGVMNSVAVKKIKLEKRPNGGGEAINQKKKN